MQKYKAQVILCCIKAYDISANVTTHQGDVTTFTETVSNN